MNTLKTILSGLAVGGAMTIPGVSGGSAAMILGIYDDLITAVSRAFSEPRKNLLLLLKLGSVLQDKTDQPLRRCSWMVLVPVTYISEYPVL